MEGCVQAGRWCLLSRGRGRLRRSACFGGLACEGQTFYRGEGIKRLTLRASCLVAW
jgi:hypothetical protein